MADPTLADALSFLVPLVGTGGVTAIVVAWFGSRKTADAPPDKPPQIGIQALLADHMAMERFSGELKRLADAAEDIANLGSRLANMIELARAVDKLRERQD